MHKERLEHRAAKRRRRENIQQAVLGTLALTGALAVIAIAPALPMALASIIGKKHLGYRAKTATGRRAQKGLIAFETHNGMRFARLTSKGAQAMALEQAKMALAIRVKKRWDRRYRMVIFDIPQKRRLVRDRLRHLMRDAGFFDYSRVCGYTRTITKNSSHLSKRNSKSARIFCMQSSKRLKMINASKIISVSRVFFSERGRKGSVATSLM